MEKYQLNLMPSEIIINLAPSENQMDSKTVPALKSAPCKEV